MLPARKFSVSFRVPGNPIPKQSFRMSKSGHAYQTDKVKDYREAVATMANNAMRLAGWREPYSGKVSVALKFKRANDQGRKDKGDVDNLAKALLDGMNKAVFADDAQVHELHVYLERGVEHPEVIAVVEAM